MTYGFCFHTATTSHILDIENSKRGFRLLKDAGMRKTDFAGGEPLLYPRFLGRSEDYCRKIGVESVSIVSNGSKVTESFLRSHGKNIDILALSCDSSNEPTTFAIGRGTSLNVEQLYRVRRWRVQYDVEFKHRPFFAVKNLN